jgi:hypothetical protein
MPQARTRIISAGHNRYACNLTTREKTLHGKFEVHYDFVAMIVISFALSFGFNLYQRYQYNDLLTQHTALEWKAQDLEINQVLNLRKLETCNNPNPR